MNVFVMKNKFIVDRYAPIRRSCLIWKYEKLFDNLKTVAFSTVYNTRQTIYQISFFLIIIKRVVFFMAVFYGLLLINDC